MLEESPFPTTRVPEPRVEHDGAALGVNFKNRGNHTPYDPNTVWHEVRSPVDTPNISFRPKHFIVECTEIEKG